MEAAAVSSLVALALAAPAPAPPPRDTGAVLYRAWCQTCHGADGRGVPSAMVRLEVPPANLADCRTSTPEPEERWIKVVTDGGASVGLSMDMPAFGEGASREQIRDIVRYVRSLCGEPGWPPGELNFARPFLVEKPFPENEWVLVEEGRQQELIYERRLTKRLQIEANARSVFDSAGSPFQGAGAALKYNVWHDLSRHALASAGLEVTPPIGRQDVWELDGFLSAAVAPANLLVFQGEISATWERGAGIVNWSYRGGVGKPVGRFVPMLEAAWDVPAGARQHQLTLYPQTWFQLSRLGHVAASVGVAIPVAGPSPSDPRLIAFLLWDYGDAPLNKGW